MHSLPVSIDPKTGHFRVQISAEKYTLFESAESLGDFINLHYLKSLREAASASERAQKLREETLSEYVLRGGKITRTEAPRKTAERKVSVRINLSPAEIADLLADL